MKTMNYLLAIAMLCMVGSCSKETPVENEDLAAVDYRGRIAQEEEKSQEKEESLEIFELELHKYSIINQLAKLDFEKRKLEELIEGGRRDLIPELELTMNSFADYEKELIDIHDKICHILGTLADELAEKASRGDYKAKERLLKMDWALKDCGIEVSYTYYGKVGIPIPGIGKTTTVGGCNIPGDEFYNACGIPLPDGLHTIVVHEILDQLIITTDEGVVSKGEFMGKSEDMNGFYEYALNVPANIDSKMSIVVSKEKMKYEVPITDPEGF